MGPTGVVERYLSAITTHDWAAMSRCVAEDVERIGPYGEVCRGRQEYVSLLAGVMPSLEGYEMTVDRVIYTGDARHAVAELSETIDVGAGRLRTPEALVFDIDEQGLIEHVSIYLRRGENHPR